MSIDLAIVVVPPVIAMGIYIIMELAISLLATFIRYLFGWATNE